MALLLPLTGLLPAAAPSGAAELVWGLELGGATGRYTTDERTNSVALDADLEIVGERWRLRVDLPVRWEDHSGIAYVGRVPVPIRAGSGSGAGPGDGGEGGGGNGGGGNGGGGNGGGGNGGGGNGGGGNGGGGNGGGPGATAATLCGRDSGGGCECSEDASATSAGSATGIGDPVLRTELRLLDGWSGGPAVSLVALVKVPLGDERKGLSTGEWDAGAGARLERYAERSWWMAELAGWRLGDPPGLDLNNLATLELETGRVLGERWELSASLLAVTEVVDEAGGSVEAGLAVVRRMLDGGTLRVRALVGLTAAAPDVSLWIGWRSR